MYGNVCRGGTKCEMSGLLRTFLQVFLLVIALFAHLGHTVQYSSQWAVHIEGGKQVADSIADKHGFVNHGEIFPDWYHFHHNKIAKRSVEPSSHHHDKLIQEAEVKWAQQQIVKSRQKRDYLPQRQRPYRMAQTLLSDPRWPQMWYLNRGDGLDMNVQPAWREGVTGRGVVVTILDDGLEKDHPDIYMNYDPQASYDVNNHDEDPMPRYDLIDSNRHGTRCAGEVAATANNSICAVGIAYGASVGGVRMLDGDVTDAVEARSLSLNPQHIDIYSASWGPDDDGKTVDGPGELATRAFSEGVIKGRSGKGSIFIWASGNGGRDHDNCNCDGYTNSIWTLSISSATENGLVPWYSEACSSTLATTYSSGSAGEKQVVTTDLHHQCTSSHTGTSASAPLAAGICALALEANRALTWRDMQHIVVRTAKPANLQAIDWVVNGVGRNVSHSFGYGLMDASAMVRLARTWKTVPEQHKCEVSAPHADKLIPAKSQVLLKLTVHECAGVNFLEHVQAKISLASQRRGDLQIHLTSPAGTRSTLLAKRPHDTSRAGFQSWPFMSVHTWGERPFGVWLLEIHNEGRFLATLSEWKLGLHGTDTMSGESMDRTTGIISPSDTSGIVKPGIEGEQKWEGTSDLDNLLTQRSEVQRTTSGNLVKTNKGNCLAASGTRCLACASGLFLHEGICKPICPSQTFSYDNTDVPTCYPCHYTCANCSGPNDYQCSSCFGDAKLKADPLQAFCYPKALLASIEGNKWYYYMFLVFVVNIVILLVVIVYLVVSKQCSRQTRNGDKYHYSKMRDDNLLPEDIICDLPDSDEDV